MNRTAKSDLIIATQTHPGETGKNNEDRFAVATYQGAPGEKTAITLAVVADGIGGHRAGEVASQLAVDTVAQLFDQTDSRAYLDLFARGFALTVQAIGQHAADNANVEGLGTTCAAVVVANRRLYTAYVGDSRIYLLREGRIKQITVDHTWVQEAIEHGVLTKDEARKHPNRHVVRRHLGAKADPAPDFRLQLAEGESADESRRNQGLPLKPDDIILLSSDGLTDLVEDQEILAAMQTASLQAGVDALTLMARQRGGFDNITMVALQVPPVASKPVRRRSGFGGMALLMAILGGAVGLIILAVIVAVGYFYYFNPLRTPTPPARTGMPAGSTAAPVTNTLEPMATAMPKTPTPITPTATATHTPPPTLTFTPTFTPDPVSAGQTATTNALGGTVPPATSP